MIQMCIPEVSNAGKVLRYIIHHILIAVWNNMINGELVFATLKFCMSLFILMNVTIMTRKIS